MKDLLKKGVALLVLFAVMQPGIVLAERKDIVSF